MVLLTRKEATARLGISVATLDAERQARRLAYIQRKPDGKVWITEEAIAEYLARAMHPAQPDHQMTGWTYRRRRV